MGVDEMADQLFYSAALGEGGIQAIHAKPQGDHGFGSKPTQLAGEGLGALPEGEGGGGEQ